MNSKKFKLFLGFVMTMSVMFLVNTVAFAAETTAISATDITITNNISSAVAVDTVAVAGLTSGDQVFVYTVATGGTPVSVGVASGTSLTLSVSQLGKTAGAVYVSKKSTGNTESTRTKKDYVAETTTAAPAASDITVVNNPTTVGLDTVVVNNVANGDIVRVYKSTVATSLIGTETASGTSVTVYIGQLGSSAGKCYVTVAKSGKIESAFVAASYISETTDAPAVTSISTLNNTPDTGDKVKIINLVEGATVDFYANTTTTTKLVTSVVVASGQTSIDATVPLADAGGTIYATVKYPNKNVSKRFPVKFLAATVSNPPVAANITVNNNKTGTADTLDVTGIVSGDVIKVYKTSSTTDTTVIGTITSTGTSATVTFAANIATSATAKGSVYVTITSTGKSESSRIAAAYTAEQSAAITATNVTITNNAGKVDTIAIKGLKAGQVVTVYKNLSGTAAEDKWYTSSAIGSGETTLDITISQLSDSLGNAGSVYITVLDSSNKTESTRTKVAFASEKSVTPVKTNIVVTNNIGSSDTIKFTGLTVGDIIKIYTSASATTEAQAITATADTMEITYNIPVTKDSAGKVIATNLWFTIQKADRLESAKLLYACPTEATVAPLASTISVINKSGTTDTITVTGLAAGTVVKIYKDGTTLTTLAASKTVAAGQTSVTFTLDLASAGKDVYITITAPGQKESTRVHISPISETAAAAAITAINGGSEAFADFATAGIINADTSSKTAYDSAISSAKSAKGSDLNVAEIQAAVDKINTAVAKINAGDYTTVADFTTIGVTGAIDANVAAYKSAITTAQGDPKTNLTIAEIQTAVTTANG